MSSFPKELLKLTAIRYFGSCLFGMMHYDASAPNSSFYWYIQTLTTDLPDNIRGREILWESS